MFQVLPTPTNLIDFGFGGMTVRDIDSKRFHNISGTIEVKEVRIDPTGFAKLSYYEYVPIIMVVLAHECYGIYRRYVNRPVVPLVPVVPMLEDQPEVNHEALAEAIRQILREYRAVYIC
jgi:hypothetical protein